MHTFTTRAFLPPPRLSTTQNTWIAKTCSSTIAKTATTVFTTTTNTHDCAHILTHPHSHQLTHTSALDFICRLWIFGKTLFGCRSRSETARITSVASLVSVSVGDSISSEPNRWRIFSSCLFIFLCWFSLTNHWRCVFNVRIWYNFYISILQSKKRICGRQGFDLFVSKLEIVFRWKFASVWKSSWIPYWCLPVFGCEFNWPLWLRSAFNGTKLKRPSAKYWDGEFAVVFRVGGWIDAFTFFSTLIFYVWSNETNRIKKRKKYTEKGIFSSTVFGFVQRYVRAGEILIWTVGKRRHNARVDINFSSASIWVCGNSGNSEVISCDCQQLISRRSTITTTTTINKVEPKQKYSFYPKYKGNFQWKFMDLFSGI